MSHAIDRTGLLVGVGTRPLFALAVCAAALAGARADIIAFQTPAANGGIKRVSKLWVDPTGNNDSDVDAICYTDFVLKGNGIIDHLEWWGDAVPSKGFQIEFWKQDPGTVAYQPYAVFRRSGAQPEAAFTTLDFAASSDPSGTTRYSLDLPAPVSLAANNTVNPRWFITIIALSDQFSLQWYWSQGLGGSNRTFQWTRADANNFRLLGEGRAMVISGTVAGLHGTVNLSDFAGAIEGQKVTVDIKSGGTVVESQTATLDAEGNFYIGTTKTGLYDVAIKSSHWLRQTLANVALPGSGSWTLTNGDVDGDNLVTVFDYNALSDAFDSVPGNAHWNANADLDGDLAVTVFDYNILSSNFDLVGD